MFDLTPLYRSTVGFDRLGHLLDSLQLENGSGFPPYNIERVGEDAYRVTLAVAGFRPEDLAIEVKENTLAIAGKRPEAGESKSEILHQGIAARSFERRFQLADFVQVQGASLENGLLHVDLKRELPEAMKPRTIAIKAGSAPKTIEGKKAA